MLSETRMDSAVAYVVTYIEVAPSEVPGALALLRAFRDTTRRADGNVRFDALRRTERANHVAVIEAWRDQAAHETHALSARAREFREKLEPLLSAACDERAHVGLSVSSAPAAAGRAGAVYVVTHVDVVPTFKEQGVAIVSALAAASRQEDGNLSFDALTQRSRPNHMTLVEAWADGRAFERHVMAAHVKQFRGALTPMSGSLYDERLYALIG